MLGPVTLVWAGQHLFYVEYISYRRNGFIDDIIYKSQSISIGYKFVQDILSMLQAFKCDTL